MQLQINSMTCLALGLAVSFLGGFQVYCAAHNVTTVEYHLKGIVQRVRQIEEVIFLESF